MIDSQLPDFLQRWLLGAAATAPARAVHSASGGTAAAAAAGEQDGVPTAAGASSSAAAYLQLLLRSKIEPELLSAPLSQQRLWTDEEAAQDLLQEAKVQVLLHIAATAPADVLVTALGQQQQQEHGSLAAANGSNECHNSTLLHELLTALWRIGNGKSFQSVSGRFFSAAATGLGAQPQLLCQLVTELLQLLNAGASSSSSSSTSTDGQRLGRRQATSEVQMQLAAASAAELHALCSKLLPRNAPLVLLLSQQGRLQQLLQALLPRCTAEKEEQRQQQLAGQLFKQLWQVEQFAAQPEMAAALQELAAAAVHHGNAAAADAIEEVIQVAAARQQLLQHVAAALAAVQPGLPATATVQAAAWRMLNSLTMCDGGSAAILQQDWHFLLDLMLGRQLGAINAQSTAAASAGHHLAAASPLAAVAARIAAAAVRSTSSHHPATQAVAVSATDRPEHCIALLAASVVSRLARIGEGQQQLATDPQLRTLMLAALPPHLRHGAKGSSGSRANSNRSSSSSSPSSSVLSGAPACGMPALSVADSATNSAHPNEGCAWCETVGALATGAVRRVFYCMLGPAAVFEHMDWLLAVLRNRDALALW
jgi:hypothetical protein